MVPPILEYGLMNIGERTASRLALVAVVLVVALALGACGRKGALDLPPSAAKEADADKAAAAAISDPKNVPRIANDPPPVQRRKPLPIDAILN
jgi:predicted small lipoprotein YifL